MEKSARPHRLSRLGRWPLLLGAVPTSEAPTRSTTHRPDRRVLPRQPARGQPPSLTAQRPTHHPNRAHAQEPPRARRMDTTTVDPLGRADRAEHSWRYRLHPRTPNQSARTAAHTSELQYLNSTP